MSPADWDEMIAAAMEANLHQVVAAHTYRGKKWNTQCMPAVLGCDDGCDYVVKGAQTGKAVVTEQVIGKLALLIGAPVPAVQIVVVPDELIILNEPELNYLRPGYAHGSPLQEDCTDKQWLAYTDLPENETRFAALAVLFGWTCASDPQMIYRLGKPQIVWSVDHGNFLPGGPNWTIAQLHAAGTASVLPEISDVCRTEHIRETLDALAVVGPEQIAAAVAAPPKTWTVTMEERRELAIMLERRRIDLLTANP